MKRVLGVALLPAIAIGLLGALGLLASGCGLTAEPPPTGPRNECTTDADCLASRCDLSRDVVGMCVALAPDPLAIYLDVVPPASFGASDTFGPYSLETLASGGAAVALRLAAAVPVEGTVRFGSVPVQAQVSFRPRDVVLAERAPRTITHTFDPDLPEHPSHDFETVLVPGRTYDVLIEPEGDDRATLPPIAGMLELGGSGVFFSHVYEESELITIVGDVRSAAGAPEGLLEVSAIDAETGELLSSVASTSADPENVGAFSFRMLSGTRDWLLRIAPTRLRQAESVFPTFVVDPTYLTTIDDPMGGPDRAQVLVPSIESAVRFAGTVEYGVANPVESAVITLRAAEIVDDATNMVGRLELVLTTDAEGRFDGPILPGIYEIEVSSGSRMAGADLGILVERRTLRPSDGTTELVGTVLHLPERTLLGGLAQAPGAEPFPSVTVRAVATGQILEGLSNPDLARRARSVDTVSNDEGEFRLALDVGVYDIVVEPSATSGYPWWVETDVGIGGGDRPVRRVSELQAPVVVDGTLESEAGVRIAGAEVLAFTRLPSGRVVGIGRATTDERGELRLLLPPEL